MKTGKPAKILIVDDEPFNIDVVIAMLRGEGYDVLSTTSGEEALTQVVIEQPDLVLLDLMMPNVDGFHVVNAIKTDVATKNIPVIIMTAMDNRASKLCALHEGAEEFLAKPLDRAELLVRVRNLLRLKEYNDFLDDYARILEGQVEARTAQLKASYIETVRTLARAAEYKDEETGNHIKRISDYCRQLSEDLGMDAVFANTIFHASPMHDVGKIAIPDHILLKTSSHSLDEREIMKSHTTMGFEILNAEKNVSPFLNMGAQIALSHHECWNGEGYPNALKGNNIPLPARIMAICDIYDALRSKRPYKKAFDHKVACDIILNGDGRTKPEHFDPAILAQFRRSANLFNQIFESYVD